ncbi:MAG: ribonucleoside-diphosphate reductase subunit alpha [Alkalispirochaeta sp.]
MTPIAIHPEHDTAAPFSWLTEHSRTFLKRGYLLDGVEPEDRIAEIAANAARILGDPTFEAKFLEYMSRGWYSLASPIWANFGLDRGLPISCYGSYVPDSMEGILDTAKEVGMMSKYGGGTSAYFGAVRGRGAPIRNNGHSEGSVNFMRLFNTLVDVTKQGSTRRGAFAAYLPIDHPDIHEFLNIKTEGNPIQGIFTGVTVPDYWMHEMVGGDQDKRSVWAKVLQMRSEQGIPYIFFSDTVNRNAPDVYRERGMTIHASNLCSEIMLASDEDSSFVCDLSSLNVAAFDEWVDTDAVETLTRFLDTVMTEFIAKAEGIPGFQRAVNFARRQRALGIGVLGWHDYLQANMIPFDSMEAMQRNARIFKTIRERSLDASRELAREFGEPELLVGTGRRNMTLMAVAPTTSSAFILGQTSQSIEPYRSNYYVKDLQKAKITVKNRHLEKLLEQKGKNTPEIWRSILENGGSVAHLTETLTDTEREVFKTFSEISQLAVVQQAAQRQKFIDQSQSLNLMIHPDTPIKDINQLHVRAWELGIKTLYYQHSINAAQEFNRNLLSCSVCEA